MIGERETADTVSWNDQYVIEQGFQWVRVFWKSVVDSVVSGLRYPIDNYHFSHRKELTAKMPGDEGIPFFGHLLDFGNSDIGTFLLVIFDLSTSLVSFIVLSVVWSLISVVYSWISDFSSWSLISDWSLIFSALSTTVPARCRRLRAIEGGRILKLWLINVLAFFPLDGHMASVRMIFDLLIFSLCHLHSLVSRSVLSDD